MASSLVLKEKEAPLEERKAEGLPFISLVTYRPVGNPLAKMSDFQRQFFFESLSRAVHWKQIESSERARRISLDSVLVGRAETARISELQKAERRLSAEKPAAAGKLSISYSSGMQEAKKAQQGLAFVVDDYARGDAQKAVAAVSDFESLVKSQNYKADDLMAVMLLIIEDSIWAGSEGATGSARHLGARTARLQLVPEKLREVAKDSAEMRLASVREMLRSYFLRHPKDYAGALSLALGLTSDQEADVEFLQERLASELARIGGFALAQKMLAAIKLRKKMDTKKCLLELGYRYDRRGKRLIVGKRTCGTRDEAQGIVSLLLAAVKKGPDD